MKVLVCGGRDFQTGFESVRIREYKGGDPNLSTDESTSDTSDGIGSDSK
jgi:hypothetical protein